VALIPISSIVSTRAQRGRYGSRSTLRAAWLRGEFPKPVRITSPAGALMFDSNTLEIYDSALAGTGNSRKATEAAERMATLRAQRALEAAGMSA
jgi:hypothetical protein